MQKKISIIVPVYNSEKFLNLLIEAIDLEKEKNKWKLEVVLIDDGSKDYSFNKIVELAKKYTYIKGIKLSRNFGHQIAVKTGLTHCTGDYVAIIDDDLQDPPSLLPNFFKYLDSGYDVAFGVRKKRKESFIKKLSYSTFYKLLKNISSTEIQLDSGDFCVMNRNHFILHRLMDLHMNQKILLIITGFVTIVFHILFVKEYTHGGPEGKMALIKNR